MCHALSLLLAGVHTAGVCIRRKLGVEAVPGDESKEFDGGCRCAERCLEEYLKYLIPQLLFGVGFIQCLNCAYKAKPLVKFYRRTNRHFIP